MVFPKLLQNVKGKPKKKVAFFISSVGMWKNDKLFNILLEDPNFEPFIVTYSSRDDAVSYSVKIHRELYSYFSNKKYPVKYGYDFIKNRLLNIDEIDSDIVFCQQPYIDNYQLISHRAIMAYIPYCYMLEDIPSLHNHLYQNLCWKMFYPSLLDKQQEAKYSLVKGKNIVVSGYPTSDYFFDNHIVNEDIWKIKDKRIKRIIWAPHHSIKSSDILNYSTFLEISDKMVDFAIRNKQKYQFVFKPHPRLKSKLIAMWGESRTEEYYNFWKESDNCNYTEGDYIDLFLSSDALIHDCSSFTAEYLFTKKPVLFLSNLKEIPYFNSFAKECYSVHYKGKHIEDIEAFLENCLLHGKDPLLNSRIDLFNRVLKLNSSQTVAGNIYSYLKSI